MDFSDAELRELAVFLARRISPELIPLPNASEERVAAAIQDWERILREARAVGRVSKVLGSAARALPKDLALQEAARLVDPAAPVRSWFAGGLMVVATAALILLTLAGFTTSGVMVAMEAAGPALVAATEAQLQAPAVPDVRAPSFEGEPGAPAERMGMEPVGVESVGVEPVGGEPVGGEPMGEALGGAPEEGLAPEDAEPAPGTPDEPLQGQDTERSGASRQVASRGTASGSAPGVSSSGLRIPGVEDTPAQDTAAQRAGKATAGMKPVDTCPKGGWVYAGRSRPDGRFVARYQLRVRSEPPTRENGWSSSMPIRCYLQKGDVVRMTQPALELPNHYYWVYVAPGSVERPDGVALRATTPVGAAQGQ